MTATAAQDNGLSGYVDRKRRLWLFSLMVPGLALVGPLLYMLVSPQIIWLWLSTLFGYVVIPMLDGVLGEDLSNPPEEAVPALEADSYYRYVTYALVPILWISFLVNIIFLGTHDLPWYGTLAVILATGGSLGFGLNLGHEMGHKKTTLERWLAKITLALGCYGHFFVEHNRGHHRDVATPEDPASARMGESIYRFVFREMPGAFFRAWDLEAQRLDRCGKSVWSLENEILQPALISAVLYGGLIAWLGIEMLPIMLLIAFWGAFQLTQANYIEHYGLLRAKQANGRYERCQPHHSWNSNHLFSNWALFHLQRHSDHHAHPTRRYQSLRDFPDLPRLPNGYFGMYLLAYFPQLWAKVMDKRLLAAVDRDPERINFLPAKKEMLMRRYNLGPQEQVPEEVLA
ncbi:alkane 1-monooxygenase [Pseudomonas neustonica]|uniref:Alkane 1-monooxygenase n=1 Tax=Pseudomonas neustonica TaxID=2487346 RepID=A0ABX9XL23_9PSED|nr:MULTISPECIES: alkane 1-monooxygenase [Pseudomonas]ROZ85683.1 alkane 1-monooxygenase [Pseudomonas sp. SSM44]ROZ87424.1 alkane 1-monooxygenase [Pseudomonas neustonica]|tara:strand:- start:1308 stop:2510 length:1203 start_codon:yes stop_codon:yes gene_type:complete